MVDITQIDHVEDGLSKLPAQWDDAPVLRGLLESFLTVLNITENDLINVRDGFNVNTAIGAQLDIIGAFFGEDRLGRDDSQYREAILNKIATSSGSGTPDDLLNLLDTITLTDGGNIWDHYPLSIIMSSDADVNIPLPTVIQKGCPAGVELQGIIFYEETSFLPTEGATSKAILETNTLDTVEVDTGGGTFDLEVQYFDENQTPVFTSQFVDSSQDATAIQSGWGQNWGGNWGGQQAPTYVPFPDMSDGVNAASVTHSTFLPWAELSEFDPITGTVNKIKPKLQFQDSGLKAKQPLPRQFFNWMMGKISDWLNHLHGQMAVGTIFQTINSPLADIPAAEAELGTRMGGTWDYLGTDSLGSLATVYVFERTA